MHNDSSRNSEEVGHDTPGPGLRAVGLDAAHERGVIAKPSEGPGSVGLTERLAASP